MSLQSFAFFGFLAVVAAVYLHLPQRWQNPFLLAASLVFYAQAPTGFLLPTLGVGAFTWLCGLGLQTKHKTAFLRLGVAGTLGILAFFKYWNTLRGVWGAPGSILMPLGVSFYSFAAIGYLVDAAPCATRCFCFCSPP